MPSIWTALQYRRAYKSAIENTTVGGLHLGERHANERGGIATKMSLSVPPRAYFDGPTITFHASFRVVHRREFASPSVPSPPFYIPSVQFSERFPPGKFRYTRRRTVTRKIKAAPFTCSAFQYVSTLSSTDLPPDSAFDFAREGVAATSHVVTFQFVPSGQIYGRLWRFTPYSPRLARRLGNKKKSQSAILTAQRCWINSSPDRRLACEWKYMLHVHRYRMLFTN